MQMTSNEHKCVNDDVIESMSLSSHTEPGGKWNLRLDSFTDLYEK